MQIDLKISAKKNTNSDTNFLFSGWQEGGLQVRVSVICEALGERLRLRRLKSRSLTASYSTLKIRFLFQVYN